MSSDASAVRAVPAIQQPSGYSLWPAPKHDRPEVLYDIEREFHDAYDVSLAATQMPERAMRRQRHYLIPQTIRQLGAVPGEAAELGCFRGLSAHLACSTLVSLGRPIPFHIFDSFEGLSPGQEQDRSQHSLVLESGVKNSFSYPENLVRSHLQAFPFIEYHKGWIPERFGDVADRIFCFVHLDVDLYEPTRQSLEFFWPRLSPHGVMLLDDYATVFFPGARRAADEFFADRNDVFLVATPSGSAAAVKLAT